MTPCGDYQVRLLELLLAAHTELDESELDRFLRGCTVIISSAITLRWEKAYDRPEGWS